MRDRVTVEIVGARLVALEPVTHELGIEPALDLADEAVADVEPHLVLDVTAIGQHDDVARGEHHGTVGRAFVRKSMHVAGAPVIEAAGLLRVSVLNHGRIFAELHREIGGISQKMLTQTLRSLERDGLVERKVYPVVPPKVEYSLSRLGRTLIEPLRGLCRWSEKHLAELQANRARARTQTVRDKSAAA